VKLGHIGHGVLTFLAGASGLAVTLFAPPAGPLAYLAWAPMAAAVAKWVHFTKTTSGPVKEEAPPDGHG
jgi:hypothetical protein